MKTIEDRKKIGKKNRQAGQRFEKKVRDDLVKKGWIVDKWSNNVEFLDGLTILGEKGKEIEFERTHMNMRCVPAKPKYNPFTKTMMMNSAGFPDFIAFTHTKNTQSLCGGYEVSDGDYKLIIFVECKSNGYLSKEEKAKAQWYLDNNICSKFLIAMKGEKKGKIIYKEFKKCEEGVKT